ncbi:putative RDD family membrane protein YckC [Actinomadura pelletieri DSM 43383]|uniref:Putative RDD family membrane protein YckC n=1 Tax=Actinomadura pelletieri DSM 43383 TaxID=1120940 RepID=A0A495QFS0_9ACTN|nr:RDD family protein [Actinomadura pelletieri]RKS70767.1 putative RDD family membrane protein YckC [Actinomadura pelletieri DSM 43383]
MSDYPDRGRRYQPQQGQGSYGPPPPYQGPQWQQPQQQPPPPQQPQQQWQDQWGQQQPGHHEPYDASYDQYGGSHDGDQPLAPIHRRAGARLIDNALVAVFGFALVLPITIGAFGLGKPGSKTEDEGGVWNWPIIFTLFCVLSVLPFLYEAVQLSMSGRTLGKRVMGLGIVQAPAGGPLTTTQAIWRAGIVHVAYQLGVFFFLVIAVMVWAYAAYGMVLVWAGALMAYLWAIWDQPLHQALHDRFAGTLVVDERIGYDEYDDEYTG